MPENVSHVVVHHYFDNGSGTYLLNMTCCIVLSVVIILILLIICVIVICMIFQRTKRNHQKAAPSILPQTSASLPETFANFPQTLPGVHGVTTKTYSRNIRRGISNPAASFDDNEMDINSNRQNIPMSTLKTNVDDMQADSSESSAGLCEVLFPQQHECEVIYETLPKVAFSERVYSKSRNNTRPSSDPRPSEPGTSRRHLNSVNNSMEWDYLESRQYGTSNDSETDRRDIVDVCWV